MDKGKSLCRKLAFRTEFAENTKLTKYSFSSCQLVAKILSVLAPWWLYFYAQKVLIFRIFSYFFTSFFAIFHNFSNVFNRFQTLFSYLFYLITLTSRPNLPF